MIELTQEVINRGRVYFRQTTSASPAVILVGPQYHHLIGQLIDGLPVAPCNIHLLEDDYRLFGAWVDKPGIACMDLGME